MDLPRRRAPPGQPPPHPRLLRLHPRGGRTAEAGTQGRGEVLAGCQRGTARPGSEAAGGHFSSGPAEAPAALHAPGSPPCPPVPARRRGLGSAGRGGAGEAAGLGLSSAGRSSGTRGSGGRPRGRRVGSAGPRPRGAIRGPRRERAGEPLPILGRSRRRRRPAVGESKVVAGRHFGIFPQPAGHCGGHGESGPMAGREARRGPGRRGREGRERERRREKLPRPARAAAAPPPRARLALLTHSHAPVAAAASSPEPAPTPAPPRRPGPGKRGPG